jgi:hypothetical protein
MYTHYASNDFKDMNRKTLLIAGLALAASHLQAQTTNSAHIKTVGDYMTAESNWLDWRHMTSLDWREAQSLGKLDSFNWQQPQYLGKLSDTPPRTYAAKDKELGHRVLSTFAHFFTGILGKGI